MHSFLLNWPHFVYKINLRHNYVHKLKNVDAKPIFPGPFITYLCTFEIFLVPSKKFIPFKKICTFQKNFTFQKNVTFQKKFTLTKFFSTFRKKIVPFE